jgi:hypothetical protein
MPGFIHRFLETVLENPLKFPPRYFSQEPEPDCFYLHRLYRSMDGPVIRSRRFGQLFQAVEIGFWLGLLLVLPLRLSAIALC